MEVNQDHLPTEDLIEGIIAVENNETANGFAKSYNLGRKTETTILELASCA